MVLSCSVRSNATPAKAFGAKQANGFNCGLLCKGDDLLEDVVPELLSG
ncbi:MAG: hypothetical protein ACOX36_06080 [Saccharofermentanales bacterium]